MSLVQVNVPEDVKKRADAAFARSGLTTPAAMKIMITQVANDGRTPLDGVFTGRSPESLPDEIKRDIIREEAKEYGIIPDDSFDATAMPQETLDMLGLTAEEVAL